MASSEMRLPAPKLITNGGIPIIGDYCSTIFIEGLSFDVIVSLQKGIQPTKRSPAELA